MTLRDSTCRTCGAPIQFVRTAAGRFAPMDVEDGFVTGMSHFATCPQASRFKRKPPKAPAPEPEPDGPEQGLLPIA